MEAIPHNVILEFHPNTLENIRKIHGFEREDVKDIVDTLEQWVKNQKHIVKKDFSRHYLENMIITSKGSLERAQNRLENVCRHRTQQPQFFGNFDITNDFTEFQGIFTTAILPKLTTDYNRIWLIKNSGKQFKSNLILQFARISVMFFEYLRVHDHSDGCIIVVDLTEVSLLALIRRINLHDLRQAATILIQCLSKKVTSSGKIMPVSATAYWFGQPQEGYGVRIKGLHVISTSRIINALIWIFKQVLSAKLVGRIHIHQSVKTVHNFITKDILPVEYGGKERSFQSIHEDWMSALGSEEYRSYLKEMTEARIDESLIEKT